MRSDRAASATTVPVSAKVTQAIEFMRQYVGEDAPLRLSWDRSGASVLPLLGGDKGQWTTENLFGRMGEFSASAPTSKLPVTEASCGYRVIGDDLEVTPRVLIRGMAARIAPASSAVGASADPVGFGPMAILTVFQVAKGIWDLLHPSISIELPGNMTMSITLHGSEIIVDFERMPSVHASAFFNFDLAIKRAVINESLIHFDFQPAAKAGFFSRFIESREVHLT